MPFTNRNILRRIIDLRVCSGIVNHLPCVYVTLPFTSLIDQLRIDIPLVIIYSKQRNKIIL